MESISKFLGFSEEEVLEIAMKEKIEIPRNSQILDELRRQHKLIISS